MEDDHKQGLHCHCLHRQGGHLTLSVTEQTTKEVLMVLVQMGQMTEYQLSEHTDEPRACVIRVGKNGVDSTDVGQQCNFM